MFPASGLATGLRGLRRGRRAHRGGAPQSLQRGVARRGGKAHPDVLELFFQVFDKGRLDDAEGREIDFRNTVIILTSNVGSSQIMQACLSEGVFARPDPEALGEALRPVLYKQFKPAFLGRMKVVPYFPVTTTPWSRSSASSSGASAGASAAITVPTSAGRPHWKMRCWRAAPRWIPALATSITSSTARCCPPWRKPCSATCPRVARSVVSASAPTSAASSPIG